MDEDREDEMLLEHYLEIGAISLVGVDENGEIIYTIEEKSKEIAPELWQAHADYVDETLIALYEKGLVDIEYDENLEATIHISPEGQRAAKEMGLIEMNIPEPPNN